MRTATTKGTHASTTHDSQPTASTTCSTNPSWDARLEGLIESGAVDRLSAADVESLTDSLGACWSNKKSSFFLGPPKHFEVSECKLFYKKADLIKCQLRLLQQAPSAEKGAHYAGVRRFSPPIALVCGWTLLPWRFPDLLTLDLRSTKGSRVRCWTGTSMWLSPNTIIAMTSIDRLSRTCTLAYVFVSPDQMCQITDSGARIPTKLPA